jgi:hypothetical protein
VNDRRRPEEMSEEIVSGRGKEWERGGGFRGRPGGEQFGACGSGE